MFWKEIQKLLKDDEFIKHYWTILISVQFLKNFEIWWFVSNTIKSLIGKLLHLSQLIFDDLINNAMFLFWHVSSSIIICDLSLADSFVDKLLNKNHVHVNKIEIKKQINQCYFVVVCFKIIIASIYLTSRILIIE